MNTKFWIAFSSIEELDSVFVRKIYEYFGDIEAAFNASKKDFAQIEGLSVNKVEEFLAKRDKINPDEKWEEVEKRGIKVLTFDDGHYPYMLKQIHNPPIVLYYKGDLFSCNLEKTVAFVGSRRASQNGRDSVRRVISELANTDICIVSGLAEGIDAVSHRSAAENNLKTIGVIASGFDFKYPASNRDLY
ncbi:DNA-protecting protein DprA, partial [bacterium]|nr:DNA-protecting protein DprA [bacterium]